MSSNYNYKIEVQIDPYWVENFTSDQIQFCYSFGVEDSSAPSSASSSGKGMHFNIVSGAVCKYWILSCCSPFLFLFILLSSASVYRLLGNFERA